MPKPPPSPPIVPPPTYRDGLAEGAFLGILIGACLAVFGFVFLSGPAFRLCLTRALS